ncbi:hypothetical protein B0H34DRAFT_344639 [Crassisporium funariophilum]|nr:hypothetical protein B0H34DRAFT_344639 [Crassisporium funariophilum]
MPSESYLVTGATRGIGLALVEEILKLKPDSYVIATGRNPSTSKGLQELSAKYPKDRLSLVTLDVSDTASVEKAVKETEKLLPNGLDHLILNAGVHHQPLCNFEDIDFKLLQDEIRYNTEYPIIVIRSFLPLIRKSTAKKIVFMTSELGSVDMAGILPMLTNAYSIAKAAFNMTARKYGALLKMEGITVIVLHPGWVQTEIGAGITEWMSTYAPHIKQMTPNESAVGCIKVISDCKLEDSTQYLNDKGVKLAW